MKKQRKLKSQRKKKGLTPLQRKRERERQELNKFEVDLLPFVKAYLKALLKDAHILLKNSYGFTDCLRDQERILHRLDNEGLSFATVTLPSLMTSFLELLETGDANFPQFKLKRGRKYPNLLGRLFHLALEGTNSSSRNKAFDCIYSLCTAFKKLKGQYPEKVLVKQFNDFIAVDRSLADINWFEEDTYFILNYARQCFREQFWNVDLDSDIFRPKPGPGATNTPMEKTLRYEPHVLYEQINNVLPYQEWFYPTPWHACLSARDYLAMYKKRKKIPSSKFHFVPKTFGKARGICMEENEMQVLQQAFRRGLESLIKQDSSLNACLPLNDQSINANLALSSSITKGFGTIDMSEASDRVSRELVAWITQDTPLHEPLMALSTRVVVPPEALEDRFEPIRVNKYAPMGSGLCFPVMSLIHLYLIRGILFYAHPINKDLWKEIRVYGDDIIAPSHTIEEIYRLLPKFGMKLNTTKSFYRSNFRESCGVHAFNGIDVTPVYIKYTPYHDSPRALASGLEAESMLYQKGFRTASGIVRQGLRMSGASMVPSHPDQSFASIRRPHYDVSYIRERQRAAFPSRWNAELQCYEFEAPILENNTIKRTVKSDQSALLRWYWLNTSDFSTRTISDSFGDLKIGHRWVPESGLNIAQA